MATAIRRKLQYGEMNLKYYHEFEDCAGLWGWIDRDFNVVIEPQYIFAQNFVDGKAIVAKGNWIKCEKEYDWENEAWGIIDTTGKEIIPCKYDDIHEIDGTDRLYLVHKNGWDNGTYAIYDIELSDEILQMDFDFDAGYMFNEMFVTEEDLLIFDEHLPGEGKDLITIYDLTKKTYIVYRDENTERTFNGEKTLSVNKDGKDIIIF